MCIHLQSVFFNSTKFNIFLSFKKVTLCPQIVIYITYAKFLETKRIRLYLIPILKIFPHNFGFWGPKGVFYEKCHKAYQQLCLHKEKCVSAKNHVALCGFQIDIFQTSKIVYQVFGHMCIVGVLFYMQTITIVFKQG